MNICIRQVKGNSGVDVWAKNLCKGLQNQGHSCSLELKSKLFEFFPDFARLQSPTIEADIVHSNSWNGFAFKQDCPLVVTEHLLVHDPAFNPYKSETQKLYHRWIHRCERKTFDIADAIVCVSRYTQQKTEELFGLSHTKMVYNGVNSLFFNIREIRREKWGIPENKCVLLYTGNLSRRKGADLLPALMNLLGDQFLLLTTSGIQKRSQHTLPNSRNLGYVNQEQLVQAYNLCDIFLIPSRLEGLSLSTLEAMSCGKPVMAFNCSSFPELVIDGKGGFLCEKENIKDFSDRICYLAEEPNQREKMGHFNRKRVEEDFTIERMAKEYIDLYKSLVM